MISIFVNIKLARGEILLVHVGIIIAVIIVAIIGIFAYWYIANTGQISGIVINEIMFEPAGPNGVQWVELYNPNTSTQNLDNWVITNGNARALVTIPAINLPSQSYLVIQFDSGTNDFDFSDGVGTLYTGAISMPFDLNDEVGLYRSTPDSSTIEDFVAWGSSSYIPQTSHQHAVSSGIWTSQQFVDTSFQTATKFVLPGESIGRSSSSVDTNSSNDFYDHGGEDAFFDTAGEQNKGLPVPIIMASGKLAQLQANLILVRAGYGIIDSTMDVQNFDINDERIDASTLHTFTTTTPSRTVGLFTGSNDYQWEKLGPNSWKEEMTLMLNATNENYVEHYTKTFTRQGLDFNIEIETKIQSILPMETLDVFYQKDKITATPTSRNTYKVILDREEQEFNLTPLSFHYEREELFLSPSIIEGSGNLFVDYQTGTSTAVTKYDRKIYGNYEAYILNEGINYFLERNANYTQYDITKNGILTTSLQGIGHTTVKKITPAPGIIGEYKIDWNLPFFEVGVGNTPFIVDGTWKAERNNSSMVWIDETGKKYEIFVDPPAFATVWLWWGAVAKGIVVAGAAIGGIWGGMKITADTTPPTVSFKTLSCIQSSQGTDRLTRVRVTDSAGLVKPVSVGWASTPPPPHVTITKGSDWAPNDPARYYVTVRIVHTDGPDFITKIEVQATDTSRAGNTADKWVEWQTWAPISSTRTCN